MKPAHEIENTLRCFSGTDEYHKLNRGKYPVYATDGVKYLLDAAECYWLADIIMSYQPERKFRGEEFQTWELKLSKSEKYDAVVTSTDGNKHRLCRQEIPYTNFPLQSVKLYVTKDVEKMVILLPGEY